MENRILLKSDHYLSAVLAAFFGYALSIVEGALSYRLKSGIFSPHFLRGTTVVVLLHEAAQLVTGHSRTCY